MASTDVKAGEPKPINKDYVEIIKSDLAVDPTFIKETGVPSKIVYYCMECKKIVTPKRIGNKFRFSCSICKSENVAFGTEKSIMNFYRIDPAKPAVAAEKQK